MCISICLIKKYVQRTPSMSLRMLSRISTKTKPKQSQTKPICEMTKMNVSVLKTMDYGKNPAFAKNGNKANPASPVASPRQVQSKFRLAPRLALGVKKHKKKQPRGPGAKRGNYSLSSLTFCQSSSVSSLTPEPVTAEIGWTGVGSFSCSSLTILSSGSRSILLATMISGF